MADVAVIGAGVAGLTAAYRLQREGHRVTVLEAKPRAGGLSHTARDGTVVSERGSDGCEQHQTVTLDDGLYVNLGPGRLPHHHRRVLNLCSELGVALEPYIMSSDTNRYADADTGRCLLRRQIEHDSRGSVAALAYQLDGGSEEERELLRAFGDLTSDGRYIGTPRNGGHPPLSWSDLVKLRYWAHRFHQPDAYLWQDTLFQPVGGMDRIWRGLLEHVGERVVFNAPVQRISTRTDRAEVTWQQNGAWSSGRFDWVLSSAPLPVLADQVRLRGFSHEFTDAVETCRFAPAAKVGWQSETRWWEEQEIYGGISYTNHPVEQLWYPSTGHFTGEAATLTGAYAAYGAAETLGDLPVPDRLRTARRGGALFHDEVADPKLVGRGMSVAWHHVPYQAGGWAHWDPAEPSHEQAFTRLQQPDGRFAVIGDQVSAWPGWQEGAVSTAERAVDRVAGREVREPVPAVPDSRWLTMGDHPDHV